MITYGIYGYEITQVAELKGFKLIPRSQDYREIKKLTEDQDHYHLTGFLEIDENQILDISALIFDLQGILSFIDQKNVIISHPLRKHETYQTLDQDYPLKITFLKRLSGGGSFILSDLFSHSCRKSCIEKILHKLKESDQSQGIFRTTFFKSIETFRGNNSFLDVNYYLLFSALESLSRYHLGDYSSKNASTPIAEFLKSYSFDISQDNVKNLTQSVSTYTHLRNALFHNGKLECELNINGTHTKLRMSEYYANLCMLVPLAILKYIDFDDGHINWNSWLDRMPFK